MNEKDILKVNKNLEEFYNSVYKKGEENHFTSGVTHTISDEPKEVLSEENWDGKTVLDVGCGTGLFANLVSSFAYCVKGIDYSQSAIDLAKQKFKKNNLDFEKIDIQAEDPRLGKYDVITSLGTLEHMDSPLKILKILKKHLTTDGKIIITSPNWANPRGHMLMTLYHLFDAPITLADLHYFTPRDFEEFAKELDMNLEWRTIDKSWAYGDILIKDLKRRIPNIFRDMNVNLQQKKIDNFINWINTAVVSFDNELKHTGATGLYVFSRLTP